ncbi:hypothetical protein [Microbacterium lacticum]
MLPELGTDEAGKGEASHSDFIDERGCPANTAPTGRARRGASSPPDTPRMTASAVTMSIGPG